MRVAIVADPDLRERMRCLRVLAGQLPVSAIGAGTWEELEAAWDGLPRVELILCAPSLPGAPSDAVARLSRRAARVVLLLDPGSEVAVPPGVTRVTRPVSDEALVLLARGGGGHSSAHHQVSFGPVDFLQMICMSGASHVLVVSDAGADVGLIEVRQGEVWTALDALGVGEEAFARLTRPEMRARVSASSGSRMTRSILRRFEELVLDSAVRLDEGSVTAPPPLSQRQMRDALASPPREAPPLVHTSGDQAHRLDALVAWTIEHHRSAGAFVADEQGRVLSARGVSDAHFSAFGPLLSALSSAGAFPGSEATAGALRLGAQMMSWAMVRVPGGAFCLGAVDDEALSTRALGELREALLDAVRETVAPARTR